MPNTVPEGLLASSAAHAGWGTISIDTPLSNCVDAHAPDTFPANIPPLRLTAPTALIAFTDNPPRPAAD